MESEQSKTPADSICQTSELKMPGYSGLPLGVRLFALVRALRWFGWGFGEPLLPVFIMKFSHTFVEAGFFSSTVEIVSLLSLPFIGVWADKVPAKRLVLWSLLLYPLVGIFYATAGVFGFAAFIVAARSVNGLTWELENIGIATYYRRATARGRIASSFGYLDTWTNVAWILAALIGMYLVSFLPIHYLLLGIAPFSIIALCIAWTAPSDKFIRDADAQPAPITPNISIRRWIRQARRFWFLGALSLFVSIINSLLTFFIPIKAYLDGTNLAMVILLGVFGALPSVFGYVLGVIADKGDRYKLTSLCLFSIAAITIWLAAAHSYLFKLAIVFLLGIIFELISILQSSLVTTIGSADNYGKRGSIFEGISTIGDLFAPMVLGLALDSSNFSTTAIATATVAAGLGCIFLFRKDALWRRDVDVSPKQAV